MNGETGVRSGPRNRAVAVRAALALVAATTLVHAGPASAQATSRSSLGGYQGTVQADGLHALYNPAGLLPIAPPVDLGAPDAYATIFSGPATFARASAADPGDLLANPGALLQSGVPNYQPGTVPAYPYRATSSTGTQAHDESSPAPGLDARTDADDKGSAATATMPGTATPAIATFGSLASSATTSTDGSTVTLHARSELSNLDVLGIVKIGSVVTDLTATSDGTSTTTSGGTVVADATVLGTPVTIDLNGVEPAPGAPPPTTNPISSVLGGATTPLVANLNDLLAHAGLHLTVAGPVRHGNETSGMLTASGLRIDFELSDRTFPVLKTLLDAVPDVPNPAPGAPSVGDLIAVAEARHLVAFEIGRGMVALTARPTRPLVAATVPATTAKTTGSSSIAMPGTATHPLAAPATPSLAAAAPAAGRLGDAGPPVPIGAGVGALALLTLLLQPFVGDRLARVAGGVLAPATATSCPWEER